MRPRAVRAMVVLGVTLACVSSAATASAQTPPSADSDAQTPPPADSDAQTPPAADGDANAAAAPDPNPAAAPDPIPTPDPTPTPTQVRPEAKQRHNEALASLRAGEIEKAYAGFIEAWNLQGLPRVPRIAGNLGRAELKLGKYRDAAEHLAFFLREEKELGDEDHKEFARQLAEAKAKVGTLRVEVLQTGAEIFIDGKSVGTSPMEAELYVEPGQRRVEAKLGARRDAQDLDVRPGATEMAQLDLTTRAPPPSPPAAPTRPLAPGFVLGSVGVLGLGAGLGAILVHADKRHQAATLSAGIQSDGGHCRPGPAAHASCAALEHTAREADMLFVTGTALLVGGAAFTAGGGAYLLWAGQAPKNKKDVQVGVVSLAGGGGVSLSGEF